MRVYTCANAAKALGISRRTIYNYINAGLITAVKDGYHLVISDTELERFRRSNRDRLIWVHDRCPYGSLKVNA